MIWGSRVSLEVGFAAAMVAMVIGGAVGVISGFFGGGTDVLLMRITDIFLVIPDIPLVIVVAAMFGRNLLNIILIIGIIYWTSTARLIRAQVKSVRERVYVKRARIDRGRQQPAGLKHVLPQVAPLLIANTVLMIALAVFVETYIAFLGLGDPSTVSWGKLIENSFLGNAVLNNAWWAVVPPGVCGDRRDPGLHDGRPVDGGCAQPAAEGRPPGGAPVPHAPAARRAGVRVSRARCSGRGPARLVRSQRGPRAARRPGRRASSCGRASGWAWWASPAAARRPPSWP